MFCILMVGFTLANQSNCVGENYDLYLLAGQSNMDGRGKVSELSEEQQKPIDQAIIFYRNCKNLERRLAAIGAWV